MVVDRSETQPLDLQGDIASMQAELVLAGSAGSIRRDPTIRLYVATQVRLLEVLGGFAKHMDGPLSKNDVAKLQGTIEHALRLVGAEVACGVEAGAHTGMRKEAQRMIRRLDRGLAVRVGLAVAAAFVCGALATVGALHQAAAGPFTPDAQAGRVWSELHRCNPFPQNARPGASGGRAVVTLWATCDQQPGDAR